MDTIRAQLFPIWMAIIFSALALTSSRGTDDPPNPFGEGKTERSDAIYGAIRHSNGTLTRGKIYLTRGQVLRIYDPSKEEHRDIPLKSVREIRGLVEKEWMEAEWRFKENASDEKVLTGRKYPARVYTHEVVLKRGGSIKGSLSAVIYIEPEEEKTEPEPDEEETEPAEKTAKTKEADESRAIKPVRYLLHKRDKGEPGQMLRHLVYVERIVLGEEARKLSPSRTDEEKRKSAPGKR
jgi:hypothetical protein